MKLLKKRTILFFLILGMTSCSAVKYSLLGTWYGKLPCADCPGINYELILKKDHSYQEKLKYLDRDVNVFKDSGNFEVTGNRILVLKAKAPGTGMQQFNIEKNILTLLDLEGNPIPSKTGGHALTKNKPEDFSMEDSTSAQRKDIQLKNKWELVHINGNPLTKEQKVPWLELDRGEKRFFGSGGCNQFGGNLEIDGDTISFGPAISTKIACKNMETERAMLRALSRQKLVYEIRGNRLILSSQKDTLEFRKKDD